MESAKAEMASSLNVFLGCSRFGSISESRRVRFTGTSAVANALRLLQLPQPLQELLECGKITAGHARALLAISDPDLQLETARRCAEDGMTVRAVEKLAAEQAAKAEKPAKKRKTTDQYYKEMELELTDRLQRKVSVTYGRKKGTLMLEFYNKEDLASLAKQLTELAEQEF